MKNEPTPSCPVTPLLASLFESGDEEAGQKVALHVKECPSCQVEVERLLQAQKNGVPEWAKDLLIGLGILVGIGVLFGVKGFNNAVSDALRKKGL